MNLLVTNTGTPQAYAITRALRSHAEKIVATIEGRSLWAAEPSHAARSRLVDKRYWVPSPVEDWWAGRIGTSNTEQEEACVRHYPATLPARIGCAIISVESHCSGAAD